MNRNDKMEEWPNVIAMVKDGEKYVFTYDDDRRKPLLSVFGRFAKNPELNFSWHNAAVLSRKVREKARQQVSPQLRKLRAW
ncbi:MAG: hypothetical protein R6U98_28280 [Pirellulaceae bacterium]